jgi:hypothetical protein
VHVRLRATFLSIGPHIRSIPATEASPGDGISHQSVYEVASEFGQRAFTYSMSSSMEASTNASSIPTRCTRRRELIGRLLPASTLGLTIRIETGAT